MISAGAHSPHPSIHPSIHRPSCSVQRAACSDISRPSRPLFCPSPLIAHSPKAADSSLRRCALPHTPEPGLGRPLGSWDHSARRRSSHQNGPFQNRIHSPPPPPPLVVCPPACSLFSLFSLSLTRSPPTGSRRIKVVGLVWVWPFRVGVYYVVCVCVCPSSVCVCVRVLAK